MLTKASPRREVTETSLNPDGHSEERMDALRVAALLVTLALAPHPARQAAAGPAAYQGAGAWIDRYDFAALPDADYVVAGLAKHGIRTLYVETGSWKVPADVDIVAPEQTADLITAAHANGMHVVAWYLPSFDDSGTDMRRIRAALDFRTPDGQAFDSFALDIEATAVKPLARRNDALLAMSAAI